MKITAQINQGQPIELPFSVVHVLLGFIDDKPEYQSFFEELTFHPASQIRADVAGKSHLSAVAYERLAHDPCIDVVTSTVLNSSAWSVLHADTLKTMIRRDVSVALEMLAWGLDEIPPTLKAELLSEILKYDDPQVLDLVQHKSY